MVHTAIIAFTLIGIMFLFTECGNKESEEVRKIEVDKDGIPKYVTKKSKDTSFTDREKEVAYASYIKKETNETGSIFVDVNAKTYNLATKENPNSTGTSYAKRDEEIALASYGIKGKVETESSSSSNSKHKEEHTPAKVVTIPKAEIVEEISSVETNVTLAEVPVEVNISIPTVNEIVVPTESMIIVSAVVAKSVASKVDTSAHEIVIPRIPTVPEVNITIPSALKSKSMEEFASNSQVKKELNLERNAKDKAFEKNRLLSQQLDEKTTNEKLLEENLVVLRKMAATNEQKARVQEAKNSQVHQSLLSQKQNLEQALNRELENEKQLKLENSELTLKIDKLLAIAKEGTAKAEAEHNASVAKMQELLSAKESLEANITAQIESKKVLKSTNDELAAKISELLAIAEEGTAKAEAEHNLSVAKMQELLSAKESLEANITAGEENSNLLQEENSVLKAKIAELLTIAEVGTAKAKEAYDVEQQEMKGLFLVKKGLEENLTVAKEHEKLLEEENVKLKEQLARIAEEEVKAKEEADMLVEENATFGSANPIGTNETKKGR